MQALIAYWRAKLEGNPWLISREDKAMIQQTIRALQALQKLRSTTQVQREADIVRTVNQLSRLEVKNGKKT